MSTLTISTETVCAIILKARAFNAKVDPAEPDPGSNPADDGEREILEDEDYSDDATCAELRAMIEALTADEAADLIALAWVGRGDYGREEFDKARALAAEPPRPSADYLIGLSMLGDLLEEGLTALGRAC
jgi:hypothetical protein